MLPTFRVPGNAYGLDVPASAIIDAGLTARVDAFLLPRPIGLGTSISAEVNEAFFNGTQVLIESDRLPLALAPVSEAGFMRLGMTITSATIGLSSTGTWHVDDLIYDVDAVAAFLDGRV